MSAVHSPSWEDYLRDLGTFLEGVQRFLDGDGPPPTGEPIRPVAPLTAGCAEAARRALARASELERQVGEELAGTARELSAIPGRRQAAADYAANDRGR